ncbi:hypothetical protein BwSH20_01110 [Bradyrhizobium ottawaense]|nr:hypothetical protein SG09_21730 [Bradyrhizobium ottawaense]GMO24272.1 hypothetical protein BwSH14_22300 [Bradyrhizobium ottawaense]GMO25670.1 hypothetical protein BwSF21_23760 [Bradyrhizobium ottawaense]GMO26943.1 hypothetical protein BwSF12_23150 [Bradyrhizobium ottawaense]GMO69143.1 hypothetical protein BwSF19_05060 [Bradyrhizobium ottawaense]
MHQDDGLRFVIAAQCDACEVADADVDRHLHAANGTAKHDAFAMKLDLPDMSVGARIVRIEADRKGKGVEPQRAARPGGSDPACCCLTPHGFSSPRRDYVPGRCEDLSARLSETA